MAKTSNVYKNKKTSKYYYVANLGFHENGKRVQIFKRGFKTAREAKKAYNEFLNNYDEQDPQKKGSRITFKEFYGEYYKSWYKNQVKEVTFITNTSIVENHLNYFYDYILTEISVMDIQKFQNYIVDEYKTRQKKVLFKKIY